MLSSFLFFHLSHDKPPAPQCCVCKVLKLKNVTTLGKELRVEYAQANITILLCLTARIPHVTPYHYKKRNGDDSTSFSVPQVENGVKTTPYYGCCWDPRSRSWWIKECPKKEEFSGAFQKMYDRA